MTTTGSEAASPATTATATPLSLKNVEPVIKNVDMSEEMKQDAIEVAVKAVEEHALEKDIAAHIKHDFDKKFGPTWHCIVGRSFGSFVTHETRHFIYFYLGPLAVLLFRC